MRNLPLLGGLLALAVLLINVSGAGFIPWGFMLLGLFILFFRFFFGLFMMLLGMLVMVIVAIVEGIRR